MPDCLGVKPKSNKPNQTAQSYGLTATFKLNLAEHRKFVTVSINDHPMRLQLYTASDITIISEDTWKSLDSPAF
ncbi:unnamed protein product [Echinostoma caproni]|uniref:Transposase n=1 Tax=Echinostoma caproni TaxID=27848 RepID=A0A183BHA5_9TREM|nr:unnamed protein product [Echinostoma caproni]